jgi:hypothetical protein
VHYFPQVEFEQNPEVHNAERFKYNEQKSPGFHFVMSNSQDKSQSFLRRLHQQAKSQTPYGGVVKPEGAKVSVIACPNCGAPRAQADGLTQCAFCGHEFMAVELTDGLYLKKEGG